jgi:hypothetical protein
MRLEDLAFFAQPMGARPVVGARTELGFPVYQDVGGNQFSVMPQAQQPSGDWSFGSVMNALAAPYRLARGIGSDQDAAAMQGVASAMTQGLLAPGRALRGEPVTYGDAFATALDYGLLGAPMAAPEGAIRANSFRAYHGSPHTFDRFSMDRIGTGEGAQAYGHGLYFTETPDVARSYRDMGGFETQMRIGNQEIQDYYSRLMRQADTLPPSAAAPIYDRLALVEDLMGGGDTMHIAEQFQNGAYSPETYNWFTKEVAPRFNRDGGLYEVQINADPNTFLDWDAPLSGQSQQVRDAVAPLITPERLAIEGYSDPRVITDLWSDPSGNMVYRNGPLAGKDSMMTSPAEASAALRDQGVPGIRYLDAGSRAAGDGSRNFVVFDDSLIQILRRYGIGAAAIGGGWAVTPEEYDAALAGEF